MTDHACAGVHCRLCDYRGVPVEDREAYVVPRPAEMPRKPEPEFHVRRDAPDTSKAVAEKIRRGTLGEHIMFLFKQQESHDPIGFTDEELETVLKRKHQSVSAARNLLVRKGYLVDSGKRRLTSSDNPAIVWVRTEKPVVL